MSVNLMLSQGSKRLVSYSASFPLDWLFAAGVVSVEETNDSLSFTLYPGWSNSTFPAATNSLTASRMSNVLAFFPLASAFTRASRAPALSALPALARTITRMTAVTTTTFTIMSPRFLVSAWLREQIPAADDYFSSRIPNTVVRKPQSAALMVISHVSS
jgi:hypothetical protein